MKTAKLILAFALIALAVIAGWQIASCELANFELADDLRDLAAQTGNRIGLTAPRTDDELRSAVIRKAKEHDIDLESKQVTVHRTGSPQAPVIAADYNVRVNLPGYSFTLHFTPSSRNKSF